MMKYTYIQNVLKMNLEKMNDIYLKKIYFIQAYNS